MLVARLDSPSRGQMLENLKKRQNDKRATSSQLSERPKAAGGSEEGGGGGGMPAVAIVIPPASAGSPGKVRKGVGQHSLTVAKGLLPRFDYGTH